MASFESECSDGYGNARLGTLQTSHGDVETPAFFPVVNFIGGPNQKSGGIWSRLRNHLFDEPEFQGAMFQAMSFLDFNISPNKLNFWRSQPLHDHFTGHDRAKGDVDDPPASFTKPLFVDSGGFKLLNSDTFGDKPEDGGDSNDWSIYTNPESILNLQLDYGADIIATLDYPIPPNLNDEETTQRMEDSIESAIRCLELLEDKEDPPAVYVAIHGHDYETINWYVGTFLDRTKHLEKSFEGFAVGSLVPLRTNIGTLVDIVQGAKDAIPENRVDDLGLHLFGISGKFTALLALLGADSFDSSTYMRAAQFKKFINMEIGVTDRATVRNPNVLDHDLSDFGVDIEQSDETRRETNWSKFTADKLPDDWGCECPACSKLGDIGFEQMQQTLYESDSYDESGSYMKSDFYALIGYHNFHVYQKEMNYVRSLIKQGDGKLLEYVAKMARNDVENVREGLKKATIRDTDLAKQLKELGYNRLVATKKEGEQKRLDVDTPIETQEISLEYTPEDFNILERDDYSPANKKVLLLLPCSQAKPYSKSRTHRVVADVTRTWHDEIHKVSISGMYGPVPQQFENLSQVRSYEYVLTNVESDRQDLVVDRLVAYLEQYGNEFDTIVGYATSRTYRSVISRALDSYGDGIVFPREPEMRSLTEHFRATNLQELSNYLNEELSRKNDK